MEYRKRERKKCSVSDCAHLSMAKGYCNTHYMRLQRRGAAEDDSYERRGHASVHPLYNSWQVIKRKGAVAFHSSWKDFWAFAKDVGERPGHDFILRKIDPDQLHGPKNFQWTKNIGDIKKRSDRNGYMRMYRQANPDPFKRAYLKKNYGISLEEYNRLQLKQDGKCAICRQPETTVIRGNLVDLSVDHCHDKGNIRGLLCSKCNQGIGCFKHDQSLLEAAIEYLKWPERLI